MLEDEANLDGEGRALLGGGLVETHKVVEFIIVAQSSDFACKLRDDLEGG